MAGVLECFQECGWPSWFCLLSGLLAVALASAAIGVALQRARARVLFSWLALAVALLPIGVGAVGMQIGRARIDQMLSWPSSDATQRERIREQGYRNAESCIAVGGTFSAPALFLALIGLVAGYALRRKHGTPAGGAA